MKSFLRENPTITFGLGLPLLLVVIFLLVSGIPTLIVAPPQYDVLYATGYSNYQNVLQITVVEQKVQVIHQGSTYNVQRPRLWRYNPTNGAVKEIAFILPAPSAPADNAPAAPAEAPNPIVINIPELVKLKIDSSSIAPDRYEFNGGRDRYSGNIFGGLFYSRRYHNQAVLTKNGRSIRLPNADNQYYSGNTQFVGWVISQ